MHKGAKFLPFGRNQVRQPKELSAAEHGWGGRPFGCRSCPRKETFVSVWDFRPPKVPPNLPCSAFLCMFLHDCFEVF